MVRRSTILILIALAGVLGFPPVVLAGTQHLISPGDRLPVAADAVRPGDQIILMPGRHRGFELTGLVGTPEAPIRITSIDADHRARIASRDVGLLLVDAKYVTIEHLDIEAAPMAGIVVRPSSSNVKTGPSDIRINDVRITATGPTGNRDAIRIEAAARVHINDCRFEGWGGSAIDLVGVRDASIESCVLTGRDRFSQANGIEIRAGSADVKVRWCEFFNTGAHAVSIGGHSPLREFAPRLSEDDPPRSRYEAVRVRVERCLVIGTACPFALLHCDDCVVRNNTLIRPTKWVACAVNMHRDPRLAPTARVIIGYNLVTWTPHSVERLVYVGPRIDAAGFVVEENLWWSSDITRTWTELGPLPGDSRWPQITTVNPRLDAKHSPLESEASLHGRDAP